MQRSGQETFENAFSDACASLKTIDEGQESNMSEDLVCEACRGVVQRQIENIRVVARLEMKQLGHKLQDFESEALYEFEELQTELLETRGCMEDLQRKLEDSERKRIQEQKLKMELELHLLRLGDESHGRGHQAEGPHHTEGGHEDWHHTLSRQSSLFLDQPGTPEQRDQEAANRMESDSTRSNSVATASRVSADQDVGMEDMALALAQLRDDYRAITAELVQKKMELAMSEEAQLRLIERFHKRQAPRSPPHLSCARWPSIWRSGGSDYKAVDGETK